MVEFQLPPIERELDCEPLGYPGMKLLIQLNPGYDAAPTPWGDPPEDRDSPEYKAWVGERRKALKAEPWLGEVYYAYGRIFQAITFPPKMTKSGEEETLALGSARAVYELMFSQGFDQNIFSWGATMYHRRRQEWWDDALKN